MISFLFWFIDESERFSELNPNAPIIVKIVLWCFLSVGLVIFLGYIFKTIINLHNERKKLSDYEKLNAKEYEIKIIDRVLKQRFEKYKSEIENKNNVCNKNGGNQ